MPRAVAMVHHRLNWLRLSFLSDRRERSSTMLDVNSTAVFTNRIAGLGMVAQSSERPRRTTNALVNAAKIMVLAAMSTNRPVNEARREEPRPSEPPPPPP